MKKRKIFIIAVALHFLIGPNYQGLLPEFMGGYLIDILLPFALLEKPNLEQ